MNKLNNKKVHINIDLNKTVQVVGETYAETITVVFVMVNARLEKNFQTGGRMKGE